MADSFKKAAALGDVQEKAPTTRAYFEHDLLPYYEKTYGPVFQSCFASTNQPDPEAFAFVAAIGGDGRVVRVYTNHETNILACVRKTLEKDAFPKPPVSPYYLHIDMHFAE